MDGTDYIGFQLQMYNKGVKDKPTYHNLKYTEWCENQIGYYRGVSHLNPIRRDIALKGKFEGELVRINTGLTKYNRIVRRLTMSIELCITITSITQNH